jgi:hypothetical protein
MLLENIIVGKLLFENSGIFVGTCCWEYYDRECGCEILRSENVVGKYKIEKHCWVMLSGNVVGICCRVRFEYFVWENDDWKILRSKIERYSGKTRDKKEEFETHFR